MTSSLMARAEHRAGVGKGKGKFSNFDAFGSDPRQGNRVAVCHERPSADCMCCRDRSHGSRTLEAKIPQNDLSSVCVEGGQGHQIDLEEAIAKAKAKVCQACDGFGCPTCQPKRFGIGS